MNSRKKLLIAYDGSASSDVAVSDMRRAGFPEEVEAVVLNVADVWFYPPPAESKLSSSYADQQILRRIEEMRTRAASALADCDKIAERGAANIRSLFPSWQVRTEATTDWPGWGIIQKAESWSADLVVIGSGGRSLMERIQVGSISHKVVGNCRCSVRVGRQSARSDHEPVLVVIGIDGSPNADAAVEAVVDRVWPTGSEIRLVSALDTRLRAAVPSLIPGLAKWSKPGTGEKDHSWIVQMLELNAKKLQMTGVTVSTTLLDGDPAEILIDVARAERADSIFVGARGLSAIERFLIGSVSARVAAQATCSVEVVRRRNVGKSS